MHYKDLTFNAHTDHLYWFRHFFNVLDILFFFHIVIWGRQSTHILNLTTHDKKVGIGAGKDCKDQETLERFHRLVGELLTAQLLSINKWCSTLCERECG